MAFFSMTPEERENEFSGISSYKDTNPIRSVPHQPHPAAPKTSLNLNYFIRGAIFKYIYPGG